MTLIEIKSKDAWKPHIVDTPRTAGWNDLGRESWWDTAVCRTTPGAADLFFSEEIPEIAAAKNICVECDARDACLEGAIRRGEPWGVWGGQLFINGRVAAQKRRRGRPPKHPRPEDQLPEVPIPAHLQKLIA